MELIKKLFNFLSFKITIILQNKLQFRRSYRIYLRQKLSFNSLHLDCQENARKNQKGGLRNTYIPFVYDRDGQTVDRVATYL